jgi:molybdenum-dependent DNA-binding transcriptional regulator ModE
VSQPKRFRPLDEKRIGLLIRMSYHRACVASKRIQEPLLRRGLVRTNSTGSYELTATGKREAEKFMEQYKGKHLETYRGLSIGCEVMIAMEK